MSEEYDKFNAEKVKCRECPVGRVYDIVVPSLGNTSDPTVMVVGECPGADEIVKGEPFVGKCGKLLRSVLNLYGYRRENTLITNTLPCRPEGNAYPSDRSIVETCTRKWLWEEIKLTRPRFLLLVGGKALKTVMTVDGITRNRGLWMRIERREWDYTARCMATFHPSYVQRAENMGNGDEVRKCFENDIRDVAVEAGFDIYTGGTEDRHHSG